MITPGAVLQEIGDFFFSLLALATDDVGVGKSMARVEGSQCTDGGGVCVDC